jgi:hypothetical protein
MSSEEEYVGEKCWRWQYPEREEGVHVKGGWMWYERI